MSLKYLFTVQYADGTVYEQTAEDKSILDPEKRSAFYDVVQRLDEVHTFTLKGDGHEYLVDLENGLFAVDNVAFRMHEERLAKYKLIFFRQHTHTYRAETREEIDHQIVYRFGWEAKDKDDKNVERVMQII